MQVTRTVEDLRAARESLTGTVGLVPTMGALHAGHMTLVERAQADNDTVCVTIFVNPTQFGPGEDFASYPRRLERDLDLLIAAGVDLLFVPSLDVMYPSGFQTAVTVRDVARSLEGASRPGHFRGVATVVAKLFNLVQPHRAYFGQKDAQQVIVLRQMVRDLNFPLMIVPVPTVREADGLALSSRNTYLNTAERDAATVLVRALRVAGAAYDAGERDPDRLRAAMRGVLSAEPLAEVAYVSVADAATLDECEQPLAANRPVLASLTVNVGQTRLLDNMLLPTHLNTIEGLIRNLGVS